MSTGIGAIGSMSKSISMHSGQRNGFARVKASPDTGYIWLHVKSEQPPLGSRSFDTLRGKRCRRPRCPRLDPRHSCPGAMFRSPKKWFASSFCEENLLHTPRQHVMAWAVSLGEHSF